MNEEFLKIIKESLRKITNPVFYRSGKELGFQGELLSEIRCRLSSLGIQGLIIQQEYQKGEEDGKKRPDLIIHIPDTPNNYVIFELKVNARDDDAIKDYKKLGEYCGERLNYCMGVFINIDSTKTHFEKYSGENKERIHSFAVTLSNRQVDIVGIP